jgi:hypothetical protein
VVEGVNSSIIYSVHFKNFCKCHSVLPPSTTIKKKRKEEEERLHGWVAAGSVTLGRKHSGEKLHLY